MVKITVGIDGMACGMCEAHINEAVRNAFPVKKVTSSHTKKETVILTDRVQCSVMKMHELILHA